MRTQSGSKQDVTQRILNGLSISLALMATFIVLPEAYSHSIDWVAAYAATRYGEVYVEICRIGWFLILGSTIFFASYLSTYVLVAIGGFTLIVKFI